MERTIQDRSCLLYNLIDDALICIILALPSMKERYHFGLVCRRFQRLVESAPLSSLSFAKITSLKDIDLTFHAINAKNNGSVDQIAKDVVAYLKKDPFLSTRLLTFVTTLELNTVPYACLRGIAEMFPNVETLKINEIYRMTRETEAPVNDETIDTHFNLSACKRLQSFQVKFCRVGDIAVPSSLTTLGINFSNLISSRKRLEEIRMKPSPSFFARLPRITNLTTLSINFLTDFDLFPNLVSLEVSYSFDAATVLFKNPKILLDLRLSGVYHKAPCPDLSQINVLDTLELRSIDISNPSILSQMSPKRFIFHQGVMKPQFFADKSRLEELSLPFDLNNLSTEEVSPILQFKNLSKLVLAGKFPGSGVLELLEPILRNLEHFSLEGDSFWYKQEGDFTILEYLNPKKLRSLSLRGIGFTTSRISKLTLLEHLDLWPKKKTPLGDSWLTPLSNLHNLRTVSLREDYGGSDPVPKQRVSTSGLGSFLQSLPNLEFAEVRFATVDTEFTVEDLLRNYGNKIATGARVVIDGRTVLPKDKKQ